MSTGRERRDGETPEPGFADLLDDDTVPLDPGPARVEPVSRRRPAAGAGRPGEAASTPRFRRPDPDEPLLGATHGVSNAQLAALRRGEPEPDERIDLHGARRAEARRMLVRRVESARARGLRAVVVIHGRGARSPGGEAVLRDALPDWLTRGGVAEHLLAFAPAPDRLGGRGATMLLLRR